MLLDECVDVASGLLARGHDVVSARAQGLLGVSDQIVLERAAALGRVLLTHNFADLIALATEWSAAGRDYPGVLLSPVLPVGLLVRRLDRWFAQSTALARVSNRYDWLS